VKGLPAHNPLVPNLPISTRNRLQPQQLHISKPSSVRHDASLPPGGMIPELGKDLLNAPAGLAAQSSPYTISRINQLSHTSQAPIVAPGGTKAGCKGEGAILQSISPVATTTQPAISSKHVYSAQLNAFGISPPNSLALALQAGSQVPLQHLKTNNNQSHSLPVYGTVTSQNSSVLANLPPRTAQTLKQVTTANGDRTLTRWNSSDSLVNDILRYAGVLSVDGKVDRSKLDDDFHILPEHDKDFKFYSEYARRELVPKRKREVIVIEDSSDEAENEAGDNKNIHGNKKARGSHTYPTSDDMPPFYDAHSQSRPSGTVENGPTHTMGISKLANSVPHNDPDFVLPQPSHLRNPTEVRRDSTFAIVIPSPNLKKSQPLLSRPTYNYRNNVELEIADEIPSATRLPGTPLALNNFPAEVRGSPAPASSIPFSMTPNDKKRGRPFSTPEATARAAKKAVRYASQQTSSNDSVQSGFLTDNGKKRGRSFQTTETAAEAAAASKATKLANTDRSSAELKKRGRPFLNNKEFDIPEGKYLPFLCEWEGCPAELHNLNTLRLHLTIVHGIRDKSTKDIPCRWAKCASSHKAERKAIINRKSNDDNSSHATSGIAFKRRGQWKEHIEEAHLIPFSWHMGDGPADETFCTS
jgi:hypothetical protein